MPILHKGHLPILNLLELQSLFQQIDTLKVSGKTKQALKDMFNAAANPNSERPDVVLKALDTERQTNAAQVQKDIGATFTDTTQRGGMALLTMDQSEWDRLVAEANAHNPTQ